MDRADLHLLWECSTWANGQTLAAAGRLPPAALREPLASTVFLSGRQAGKE